MRYTKLATAALALCAAATSFGWNDTGHMIIAAIAEGNLDSKAWDECTRLLKVGGTDDTKGFIASGVWADQTRNNDNAPWHYINYGLRTDGKKATIQPAEQNVVWAIQHFSEILKDKSKPDAERADALRYLIHFVGDIHQPLHAVTFEDDAHPNGDKGGNDFPVKTTDLFVNMENPPKNLHSLWDMGVGAFMPGTFRRPLGDEGEARVRIDAQTFMSRFTKKMFTEQVKDLDPADWAKESFEIARDTAYKVPVGGEITIAYAGVGKSIASSRAALAGYRLAELLNSLIGKK